MIINFYKVFFVLILVYSCNISKKPKVDLNQNDLNELIKKSVEEWIDSSKYIWFEKTRYTNGEEKYYVTVDSIMFNSEANKLISFATIKYEFNIVDSFDVEHFYKDYKGEFLYDSRCIIGYKDSLEWKYYPFNPKLFNGFMNEKTLNKEVKNYYFNLISNYDIVSSIENDKILYKKIGYNIDENAFWDSSVLWSKNNVLQGYYFFELKKERGKYVPLLCPK